MKATLVAVVELLTSCNVKATASAETAAQNHECLIDPFTASTPATLQVPPGA